MERPEVLPTPPENEDDLNESSAANVGLTSNNDAARDDATPHTVTTNGFAKDVDLADEDVDESRFIFSIALLSV